MSVSYKESAKRHFDDATHLESVGALSLGNSSQLFGISVECGLKAILIGLGVSTKPDGGVRDTKKFGHLPTLGQEFVALAHGQGGAKYVSLLISPTASQPLVSFVNWSVHARYNNNSWHATSCSAAVVANQRADGQLCLQALQEAILDGVVV